MAVDNIGLRPSLGVVKLGRRLVGVAHRDQVYVTPLKVVLIFVFILVNTDSQNGQIRTIMVQIDQSWHLSHAGCAPCGPEVEQNDFSAIIRQMYGRCAVRDFEIGSNLPSKAGASATVAGGNQRQRHEEYCKKKTI